MNKIIEEWKKVLNTPSITDHLGDKGKIVMLLGAGFSIDQGYPRAVDVAEKLTSLSDSQFFLSSEGVLCDNLNNDAQIIIQDSIFHRTYLLLIDLIKLYCSHKRLGNFNYEEFYDLINISQRHRFSCYDPIFDIFNDECKSVACKYTTEFITYEQLLRRMPIVYSQVIEATIRKNGMTTPFYADVHTTMDSFPNYTNFLRFLKKQSVSNIIDVFTLNHDLFFESFRNVQELQDDIKHCSLISDGFDDYGSEFFGVVKSGENLYKCRLERYTGRYNTSIRLYKLHGSFDYVLCYKMVKTSKGNYAIPIKYVKSKKGIMPFEFYKSNGCKMKYELCFTDYCESFLSGTVSKTLQYADKLLYAKLFKRFNNCLRNANKLIIIGYSGNDKIINNCILRSFDYRKGKCTIIDYAPGKELKEFAKQIDADILTGRINEQIINIE